MRFDGLPSRQQTPDADVLIQLRPVESEWGNLDPAKFRRGASGKTRILFHGEANLAPALHHHDNHTVQVDG